MYPRNATSPPRISVGAVVQISDGVVQTAGVSIVVRPEGGAETAGAGTLSYGATSGVVYYTPTQAETDYTAFVVVAYKAGCIPVEKAVVTSARSVSGEVQVGGYASGQVPLQPTVAGRTLDVSAGGEAGIDLANIGSPTTTVNLSGVTIKTATDIETDTQDIQSRIPAALVDGKIAANAQVVGDKTGYTATVSDKTGFKLASDGLALVTAWTVGITGNLTGNVTGSVGSISGVTFPANFGSLGIQATGEISTVATVNELGPSALSANSLQDQISASVAGIQVLSRLDSMIESDGAGQFRFDAIALEEAPTGGGGGGGGGDTDWTANERAAFRTILGFDSSGNVSNPSSGVLDAIKDKTDLITSGSVQTSIPVTAQGQINGPLYIGDDYLAANGRSFDWIMALPTGFVAATSTCKFGMIFEDESGVSQFNLAGTVTDVGGGNVRLRFELPRTTTGTLKAGFHRWSTEIVSAAGVEVTAVAYSDRKLVEWREKQT